MQAYRMMPADAPRKGRLHGWLLLLSIVGTLIWSAFTSDPIATSLFLCLLVLATNVRLPLPLPLGDPFLVLLAGYALLVCAAFVGIACMMLRSGNVLTAMSFLLASLLLLRRRLARRNVGELVRAQFVEAGVTLTSQHTIQQTLSQVGAPLLLKVSPFLACCYCDGLLSSGVSVRTVSFVTNGVTGSVDVWCRHRWTSEERGLRTRPRLVMFIHGGSWRALRPRCHAAVGTLHALAAAGWTVVACSYRKTAWPHQLDDAYAALRWTLGHLPEVQNLEILVISGNSAGGHLAALVTLRALQDGIAVHGCFMGYPAVDPYDELGCYPSLPFNIAPLNYRRKQSLLAWFFETCVLKGQPELWESARPVLQPLDRFPPTLIMHGDLDSVVPVEHSRWFLKLLADARGQATTRSDALVEVHGARHSFEIVRDDATQAVVTGIIAWIEGLAPMS